jgi:hypothetical protein
MLLWRNLDRVDDRNLSDYGRQFSVCKCRQIFIRGRRTELGIEQCTPPKHVSRKLPLSKSSRTGVQRREECLNTHLAYRVRREKIERLCRITKPIM